MSTAIVQLNVSQTQAPAPSNQQQLGAIISQGATTLAANAKQLLTQKGDLAALLVTAKAITSMAWNASVVTVDTTAAHGIPVGDSLLVTIAGVTPAGYNGTYLATATDADSFTFPLVANPGAVTVQGTWIPEQVAELTAMNTTFWAQGSQAPVYVLELGLGSTADGVTALEAYIDANTINNFGPFYAYLVPRAWAAEATYPPFVAGFASNTGKTYFFTTADNGSYASFTAQMKSTSVMIEAPGKPATEFSHAADFRSLISQRPSAANRVPPFRYRNMFGVTQYPQVGNAAIIDTYLAAFVNLMLSASEGGLTNTVLRNGQFKDGRDYLYWYSVDWTQINVQRDLAAAIINGSNNPQAPLYYNQQGVNQLQAVLANTVSRGNSFGLIFGAPQLVQMEPADFVTAVENGDFEGATPINAQPFLSYVTANPNDFTAGIYNGLQFAMTPNKGFSQITVNLNVTDFVAGA
jgi:hypothetical protein